jgi:DNA-binding winged helix-turn-helix (wHTH) protein
LSSTYADDNNVRQQVKGLRTALAEVGVHKLVENQPGRGYYIAGTVTARLG